MYPFSQSLVCVVHKCIYVYIYTCHCSICICSDNKLLKWWKRLCLVNFSQSVASMRIIVQVQFNFHNVYIYILSCICLIGWLVEDTNHRRRIRDDFFIGFIPIRSVFLYNCTIPKKIMYSTVNWHRCEKPWFFLSEKDLLSWWWKPYVFAYLEDGI